MLAALIKDAINKIDSASNLNQVEDIRLEFFGKSGVISLEMRKLSAIKDDEEKKKFGREINLVKQNLEEAILSRKKILEDELLEAKLKSEKIDITLSSREKKIGSIHPITQAKNELVEIFAKLGFEVKEGPNIETDWFNFTALNIDENHPARQEHDTFYMPKNGDDTMVLRTHTSPVQIRSMLSGKPPFKFIAPGRTYRSDYDQTHTPMFHQIEVLRVDETCNMQELKYLVEQFISAFFEGQNPEVRLRPSFFPFTSPSAEVDIRFSGGKWLEVLGCGMIHPEVLRHGGVDPKKYQGFALGLGIERMAMLKYGIKDLRQFFENDQRWQEHYGFSPCDIPSISNGLTK
jgi:phenylalanyl-tRNA synthetase alpha chain